MSPDSPLVLYSSPQCLWRMEGRSWLLPEQGLKVVSSFFPPEFFLSLLTVFKLVSQDLKALKLLGWVYPLFEAYPCLKPTGQAKKKVIDASLRPRGVITSNLPAAISGNVTAFIVFVFGMRYCNGKQELL